MSAAKTVAVRTPMALTNASVDRDTKPLVLHVQMWTNAPIPSSIGATVTPNATIIPALILVAARLDTAEMDSVVLVVYCSMNNLLFFFCNITRFL